MKISPFLFFIISMLSASRHGCLSILSVSINSLTKCLFTMPIHATHHGSIAAQTYFSTRNSLHIFCTIRCLRMAVYWNMTLRKFLQTCRSFKWNTTKIIEVDEHKILSHLERLSLFKVKWINSTFCHPVAFNSISIFFSQYTFWSFLFLWPTRF